MYCSGCGAPAGESARFCNRCGARIDASGDEAKVTAMPPTPAPTDARADEPRLDQKFEMYRVPILARAWPRYWARSFDVLFFAFVCGVVLAIAAPQFFQAESFTKPGGELLLNLIILPVALGLDAVWAGVFGTTPGKALAGLRVRTIRNEKASIPVLVRRNLRLYFSGLAIGFPIVTLFTLVHGYQTVKASELVSWDRITDTRCYEVKPGTWRTWVTALSVLIALVLTSLPGG